MGLDFTPELLIVDDREENLELLRALLRKVDVNLELIQSPIKALQHVEEKEYALIILDVQMPQMDGFLLADKIRKGKLNQSTPIVFLTAVFLDKDSELKGYKCGCADFIMKPFNSTILINKVNIFLDLYKSRKIVENQNFKLSSALDQKDLLESRLRNLASNYRTILEGQTELIFKVDSSLKIGFANKAFSDFFDYTLDGISKNSLAEINQELYTQIESAILDMNGRKRTVIAEKPLLNYQSDIKYIEWTVFKEVEFDGIHYLIVGRDVSDKIQLRDSLVKKEKLLRKTQKVARIGSWEWDSLSNVFRGSDELYRIYEIPIQNGENIFEQIRLKTHPDDRPAIERMLVHLPKKNQKLEFQHRLIGQNGKIKHFKIECYCFYNEDSDVLNLYGISCDISQDKVLEMTFKEGLEQDVQVYANKVFFELDANLEITYLNDFGCKFLEYENKAWQGNNFLDFFSKEERNKLKKVLHFESQKRNFVLEEFTIITSNENAKNIVLCAFPYEIKKSDLGVRGVILDLTDKIHDGNNSSELKGSKEIIKGLKRKEKEFELSAKKLEKKVEKELEINEFQRQLLLKKSELETLGKMASSIVNEINQPLTGISMIMDNILLRLSMNKIDEGYIREKCAQVFQDIDRIKKYLSQIGVFNSSQRENKTDSIDVNNVVKDAIGLIQKQYKNSPVEIKLDVNPESLYVCGNKYKLQKAILDILNNSYESIGEKLKKNNPDKSDEWIQITTDLVKNDVVISIKDNGKGIDPENLNYIFEPFFTTKQTGIGSGLGLYISKGIIQKMNGKIAVNSKKDEFTEMKLILPFEVNKEKKEVN